MGCRGRSNGEGNKHLEVRQLDDHLDVGIRGALELLDQALSVALVLQDTEVMRTNGVTEVLHGGVDGFRDVLGDGELDELRLREVRADIAGHLKLLVQDLVADIVVEAKSGGAVHHGVLAHETGGAVLVDDELHGNVIPAVLAVAVPVLVRALLEGDRRGIVKADGEGRGLDVLKRLRVLRRRVKENLAGVGPGVAVLRSESTDGRGLLRVGEFVDALELLLELAGGELLTIDLVEGGMDRALERPEFLGNNPASRVFVMVHCLRRMFLSSRSAVYLFKRLQLGHAFYQVARKQV